MPEVTFSYQVLMNAVFAATTASGSVYPCNHNYIAIPQAAANSIVQNFDSRIFPNETPDCHSQARRLWYNFKEYSPLCACGIVRLMAPFPCDLVGIVTAEDLMEVDTKISNDTYCLTREWLVDDLSELSGFSDSSSVLPFQSGVNRTSNLVEPLGALQTGTASNHSVEMTLIEPQTKLIFKKSQGGVFGIGKWPASEIRAFAVWF
jgi:hypothetical protein